MRVPCDVAVVTNHFSVHAENALLKFQNVLKRETVEKTQDCHMWSLNFNGICLAHSHLRSPENVVLAACIRA
jgi:hypothetical protein